MISASIVSRSGNQGTAVSHLFAGVKIVCVQAKVTVLRTVSQKTPHQTETHVLQTVWGSEGVVEYYLKCAHRTAVPRVCLRHAGFGGQAVCCTGAAFVPLRPYKLPGSGPGNKAARARRLPDVDDVVDERTTDWREAHVCR